MYVYVYVDVDVYVYVYVYVYSFLHIMYDSPLTSSPLFFFIWNIDRLQVVNDRWEVALGLTDGSGFQQAKGPAAIQPLKQVPCSLPADPADSGWFIVVNSG